jgi:4-diphosphocytidyl-2-C-methyl-D-erythritol kinase
MIHALYNLPAPAKINLFLHVTGRRSDGYHLLQTIFQFIDLYDYVDLVARFDQQIVRVNPHPSVPAENDLVVRAARLLKRYLQTNRPKHMAADTVDSLGVDISLEKNIPMGAGLGGGSSDAATTLIGLNKLWDCRLTRPQLAQLGVQLGADVAVFVRGFNALATGIGERLRPIKLPICPIVLVKPATSVPTASIFKSPELTRNTEPLKIAGFPAFGQLVGKNDLEPVAAKLFQPVGRAIKKMQVISQKVSGEQTKVVVSVRMSGSGACVFAWCSPKHQKNERAAKRHSVNQQVSTGYVDGAELNEFAKRLASKFVKARFGSVSLQQGLTQHPLSDF